MFDSAEVEPERPVGLTPMTMRAENKELSLPPLGGDAEKEIARNLEGLTGRILNYREFEEIPRQYR